MVLPETGIVWQNRGISFSLDEALEALDNDREFLKAGGSAKCLTLKLTEPLHG